MGEQPARALRGQRTARTEALRSGCTDMTPLRRLASTIGLILVTCGDAAGQDASREGFWWSMGAGAARVEPDCDGCETLPDSIPYGSGAGFHVSLAMGGTLSPRLIAGAAVAAAARRGEGRDATLASLSGVAQFYPSLTSPLFLRGGVGLSSSTLAGGGTLIEATGVGAHLDLGIDLWRSGGRVVAAYAGVTVAANQESTVSVTRPEPLGIGPPRRPRAIYVGASVSWY